MKKGKRCPKCTALNVPGAFQCGQCGENLEKVKIQEYEEEYFWYKVERTRVSNATGTENGGENAASSGSSIQAVTGIFEAIGWLVLILGIVSTLIVGTSAPKDTGPLMIIYLLPGVGITIGGLFMIMGARATKAVVESAEYSKKIYQHITKNRI